MAFIEAELHDVSNAIEAIELGPELDHWLLEQHKEQISGLKTELTDIWHNIVTLDEDYFGVADKTSVIIKAIFSTRLQFQGLLQHLHQPPFKKRLSSPRLMFPTSKGTSWSGDLFGNILMTRPTVKPQLSNPVKLVYLHWHSRMAQLGTPSKAC